MSEDSNRSISRRQFAATTALAALSAAIVPSRVLGAQAPSNKLNIAGIGVVEDSGTLDILGSHQKNQNDRDRKQWTGAATYFLDTAKGSHTLKVGGEILKELQWFGVLQGVGGDIEHVYNNGVANQVIFRIPTATQVGGLKDNDEGHLTTRNGLDQNSLFVNDTWAVGRLTLNGGVRWDYYNGWLPEQNQLAATVGPVSVAAKTFA